MTAYVIAHIEVVDRLGIEPYQRGMIPTVDRAGGRILSAGPAFSLEGNPLPNTNVIIEFASFDAATQWYEGEEYQSVLPYRHQFAVPGGVVAVLRGLPQEWRPKFDGSNEAPPRRAPPNGN